MFEFGPGKSAANKAKHGIDFNGAQALWLDDNRIELPSRHGGIEERWLVIAQVDTRRWTAIVTFRQDETRIISCRRARRNEERLYDEAR